MCIDVEVLDPTGDFGGGKRDFLSLSAEKMVLTLKLHVSIAKRRKE